MLDCSEGRVLNSPDQHFTNACAKPTRTPNNFTTNSLVGGN